MTLEDLKRGDHVILRQNRKDGKTVEAIYIGKASSITEAMEITGTRQVPPLIEPMGPFAVFEMRFGIATAEPRRVFGAFFIESDGSLRDPIGPVEIGKIMRPE